LGGILRRGALDASRHDRAYKAIHDRLGRARRLERTRSDLRLLLSRAPHLKRRTLIERATRILAEHTPPLPAPAPTRRPLHPADE